LGIDSSGEVAELTANPVVSATRTILVLSHPRALIVTRSLLSSRLNHPENHSELDMDSSNTSTSQMDTMTPYLHFTSGDNLFFKSWRPTSNGAIAGASIALVVLAISERLLSSIRRAIEARWRRSALAMNAVWAVGREIVPSRKPVAKEEDICEDDPGSTRSAIVQRRRTIPPFVLSHDAARGALYSLQALLSYALMLAVMTFQAAYIISIVIGLGLGEILFGRIARDL